MVYVKQKRDERAENEGGEGKEGGNDDTVGGARKSRKRLTVRAVKLGNNQITEVSTLVSALEEISIYPSDLTWLDLSYNKLTTIDEVIARFPNLRTLYLHANGIKNLNDIAKLGALQNLKQLTLHGNPCADTKDYRLFVIDALPGLHQLDFSLVTNQNRDNAYTWRTHNLKRLKNLDKKLQIKLRQVQPHTWKTPALANRKKETMKERLAVTSIPQTPGTHKRIAASGMLAETF
jgi:Leucine-rich repeat (LRR) protein